MSEYKVIVLGTTPSRFSAPIADESWKVWTIGPGGKDANRWDRLFEIHGSHETHSWPEDFKGYLNDLSNVKPPQEVWMMDTAEQSMGWWSHRHKKTPSQLKADITGDWSAVKVIDRDGLFRKYGRMWFSSSISWCIAQAIEEGVTDLWLAGIDLESGEEYISQFVGAKFFITYARLKGINVYMPKGCGLERDPTAYPDRYETEMANAVYARLERGNAMLNGIRAEYDKHLAEQYRIEGRVQMLREIGGEGPLKTAEALEAAYREQIAKVGTAAAQINSLAGEMGAFEFFRHRYVMNLHDPV